MLLNVKTVTVCGGEREERRKRERGDRRVGRGGQEREVDGGEGERNKNRKEKKKDQKRGRKRREGETEEKSSK